MFFIQVDIAYAPFIERFHPFFLDVKKYDIIAGRPKLAYWIKVSLMMVNACLNSHDVLKWNPLISNG